MKAVVYCRVSTDAQERDGTSLETQEKACVDFARSNGWHVVECVRDSASGFTLERQGIERVRSLLRQGVGNVVIAHAVDRLSRNQNHIGVLFDEVQQAGARLEFVTERFEDTAVGRFILAARAFVAEVERDKIVERTTRGRLERARKGRIPSGSGKGCYGYKYNKATGVREVDDAQASVVERIFKRFAETRSLVTVATELNDEGIPSFAVGRWAPIVLRRILSNQSYIGRYMFRRTQRVPAPPSQRRRRRSRLVQRPAEEWMEVAGASPRIIDDATWNRVQEILHDPERSFVRKTTNSYPLRGRARCSVCGGSLVGQMLYSCGRPYRYYRCRHAWAKWLGYTCDSRYVPADKLETAMWGEIRKILMNPMVIPGAVKLRSHNSGQADPKAELEKKLQGLAAQEHRLVRLYATGEASEEIIQKELAEVRRQKSALNDRLAKLASASMPVPAIDTGRLTKACQAVAAWLDKADANQRLAVLEGLQISLRADRNSGTVKGVLPVAIPAFITLEQSSRSP